MTRSTGARGAKLGRNSEGSLNEIIKRLNRFMWTAQCGISNVSEKIIMVEGRVVSFERSWFPIFVSYLNSPCRLHVSLSRSYSSSTALCMPITFHACQEFRINLISTMAWLVWSCFPLRSVRYWRCRLPAG